MLRVVVRAGMTMDMAEVFLADLRRQTATMQASGGAAVPAVSAFSH